MKRRPASALLTLGAVSRRRAIAGLLALGLGASGCNMFARFATKARGTFNTLGKRNVDFDRPAPAERDLEHIHTVRIAALEGPNAQKISGYLATYLSDSERFTLLTADAPTTLANPPDGATLGAHANAGATIDADSPTDTTGRATIEGSIVEAGYDERMDSQTAKCGENKTCTTRTRIGTAAVSVNLRLVDDATGEILLQKTVDDRKETTTSAQDGTPPSIDGQALVDEACLAATGQFFAAVSPHVVQETVFFETDRKAKSLKEGANRAMSGDLAGAIEAFERGLAEAEEKRDEDAIAKARFDLGLAYVIAGDHERGVPLLRQAQQPKSRTSWSEIVLAAEQWEEDAQRAKRQWAARGEPPELDPAMRQSEGAIEDGAKTIKALRAATGR